MVLFFIFDRFSMHKQRMSDGNKKILNGDIFFIFGDKVVDEEILWSLYYLFMKGSFLYSYKKACT